MDEIRTNGAFNSLGNIRCPPEKVIEERHGNNFIKVLIYEHNGGFLYGYQIKIAGMIRQKAANVNDRIRGSSEAAFTDACKEIQNLCMAKRSVREIFIDFDKIMCYNQLELFTEDIYEQ
jgi:hypothetical protein